MSKINLMRDFISDRLTAAAAEIFGVFEQIIVQYEEEIERQRKVLDTITQPQMQQHDHMGRDILSEQQSGSSLNQETEADHSPPEPNRDAALCDNSADTNLPEQPDHEEEEMVLSGEEFCYEEQLQLSVIKEEQEEFFTNDVGDLSLELDAPASPIAGNHDPSDSETSDEEYCYPLSFKCKVCKKKFTCQSALKKHKNVHVVKKPVEKKPVEKKPVEKKPVKKKPVERKPATCQVCGKTFSRKESLTAHMRIHTGEKPYSCKLCGRCFTQSRNLTFHMRRHAGEKPYSCEICSRAFVEKSSLKQHFKTHVKAYSCKVCGKRFSEEKYIGKHMEKHTGERQKKKHKKD